MAKSNNPDKGLERVGEKWRARYAFNGVIRRSKLFRTKTEAKHFYTKVKAAELSGGSHEFGGRGPRMTGVFEEYLYSISRLKDEQGERGLVKHWQGRFAAAWLRQITTALVQNERERLCRQTTRYKSEADRPISLRRVNMYVSCLSRIFTYYSAKHKTKHNPCLDLKPRKYPEPKKGVADYYTDDEKVRIGYGLEEIRGEYADAWWFNLLSGARRSEQFKMLKSAIRWEQGFAKLPDTKNGNPKQLLLESRALAILRRQCERYPTSLWVWPSRTNPNKHIHMENFYKRVFRPVCARLGIDPDKVWHSGRHTFASDLLEVTGDLLLVMQAGGWSSWDAVQIYARVRDERIRQGLKDLESKVETVT